MIMQVKNQMKLMEMIVGKRKKKKKKKMKLKVKRNL